MLQVKIMESSKLLAWIMLVLAVHQLHAQAQNLATRLLPPPQLPSDFSRVLKNNVQPGNTITFLTLFPNSNNKMLAKIHTENRANPAHTPQPQQWLLAPQALPSAEFKENKSLQKKRSPQYIRSLNVDLSPPPLQVPQQKSPSSLQVPHQKSSLPLQVPQQKRLATDSPSAQPFIPSPRLITTKYGNILIPSTNSNTVSKSSFAQSSSSFLVSNSVFNENESQKIPRSAPESPEVIWGQQNATATDALNSSQNHFSLNDLVSPSSMNNRIIFPDDSINDVSTWVPLPPHGAALPLEQDDRARPASNTFAKVFATLPTARPLAASTYNTTHHLFVRTTPTPISQTEIHQTTPITAHEQRQTHSTQAATTRSNHVTTSTFLDDLHNAPPIDLEEPEYVIHLNSTDRIKQLINILKDYLKNPVHQLPSEFASFSSSGRNRNEGNRNNGNDLWSQPFRFTTTERTARPGEPSTFQNGFLSILHPNKTENTINVRGETQDANLDSEDSLSRIEPSLPISNLFSNSIQYDIPYFTYADSTLRPTPKPVKLQTFDGYQNFADPSYYSDLLQSPSFTSLLTIARASVHNNVSSSLNHLLTTTKQPSGLHNELDSERRPVTVSAKASECPKLFGELNLICHITPGSDSAILTKTWKKRTYSSSGVQSQRLLTRGDRILEPDERLSLQQQQPGDYNLRIAGFKIQDVGSYECGAESTGGEGHQASSQVVVFTCL